MLVIMCAIRPAEDIHTQRRAETESESIKEALVDRKEAMRHRSREQIGEKRDHGRLLMTTYIQ